MGRRILKELCITKACPTFLKLSELSWLPRKLENSLPGNLKETCSCRYRLEGHESRLGRDCLCHWKDTSYDLILVIIDQLTCWKDLLMGFATGSPLKGRQLRFDPHYCWLTKMGHYEPVQITTDAPILEASYTSSSSTAVTAHAFSTKTSNRNLMTTCQKNLLHGLDIANPFPPDLWGYAHGFGYHDVQWSLRGYRLHIIEVRNLEARLLAIILIHDVYVSLVEQNTTRKGREYKNAMQMLQKRNAAKVRRHTRMVQTLCTSTPYKVLSSNACCRSPHPNA